MGSFLDIQVVQLHFLCCKRPFSCIGIFHRDKINDKEGGMKSHRIEIRIILLIFRVDAVNMPRNNFSREIHHKVTVNSI